MQYSNLNDYNLRMLWNIWSCFKKTVSRLLLKSKYFGYVLFKSR